MSNRVIPQTANPHQFRFATTHRTEDGFEFVIVAKSAEELEEAWEMIAGPARFDDGKVSEIQIKKA